MTRQEFGRVFKLGKRTHTSHFALTVLPHTPLKVAVVVSKKVAKRAVDRNRLRRECYQSFLAADLDGGSYILILKPGARDAAPGVIFEDIQWMFGKRAHSR